MAPSRNTPGGILICVIAQSIPGSQKPGFQPLWENRCHAAHVPWMNLKTAAGFEQIRREPQATTQKTQNQ
jgi:hypothetical protein